MRKTYKSIISLCAVLIFALSLIPVPAQALGDPFTAIAVGGLGGASGAGLFSSMASASGISIGYSNQTVDQADALWNSLNPDHVYFDGEKGQVIETDPQTGIPTVYDYIKVDIGDWLQAQNDFIDEFVTDYNVTDNSTGNVSVNATFCGYPMTLNGNTYWNINVDRLIYGQSWTKNYGPNTVILEARGGIYINNNFVGGISQNDNLPLKLSINSNGSDPLIGWGPDGTYTYYSGRMQYAYGQFFNGYTTTWVSGTVNTGHFDQYISPIVKIPANSWSPSDPVNWNVAEFLEELTVKLVSGYADQIIIEDDQGPTPPPVPIPSTPLGDIPTDEWYDLFGLPVLEGQEEIHQDLQDFNDSVSDGLSDLGDQLDDVNDNLESIDTNIGTGNGLLGDLKSIGQSIVSKLDSILQGVQDLVQEIVLSTETFIAGLLNSIMGGLGGWLSTMREAFSIWHYVVEWVGSISTVFSWFWSVAGSTSYYIQLPIYASLAGAIVLAFYKRFGK